VNAPVKEPTDRGGAAVELLTALFPPPLEVLVSRDLPENTRATWIAIPSAQNPRLLVPVARGSATSRMLRRQLTGRRLRTRVARGCLSLAVGSGALGRMGRLRIAVAGPAEAHSVEEPLRRVLGVDDLRLAMPIGPARANRKPVLQVADSVGRVRAFVKVGHNPLTSRLVREEGEALRRIEVEPLRDVRAPRVLDCLRWGGNEVLVLEPLDIPTRRLTGEAGRERLLAVVQEVAHIGGRGPVEWQQHPYRETLLARVEQCGDLAGALRRQVEQIGSRLPLASGSWHGDLNSGNIALVAGPCPVWDWERFESGVPLGFDLLHHQLHQSITVGRVPADVAASRLVTESARILAPLGVDPAAADAVARTYLVTLAARYVADDQRGAGAELGRVHEWLLPALEEAWA
jgi:hypothetical protein